LQMREVRFGVGSELGESYPRNTWSAIQWSNCTSVSRPLCKHWLFKLVLECH
jgi:hypothetical protein